MPKLKTYMTPYAVWVPDEVLRMLRQPEHVRYVQVFVQAGTKAEAAVLATQAGARLSERELKMAQGLVSQAIVARRQADHYDHPGVYFTARMAHAGEPVVGYATGRAEYYVLGTLAGGRSIGEPYRVESRPVVERVERVHGVPTTEVVVRVGPSGSGRRSSQVVEVRAGVLAASAGHAEVYELPVLDELIEKLTEARRIMRQSGESS